jgi:hypothetical protein
VATVHLVDASPYIFRAHFSLPGSIKTPDGLPAAASYGFTSFLLKLIADEKPTHLGGTTPRRVSPPMNAAKEEVLRILELLLEDASLEDIQYHIYVRQQIELGLEDVEAGRTLFEEEFDQRMAKWLEP